MSVYTHMHTVTLSLLICYSGAPHASFALQNGPTNARLRESIEVRLFVITTETGGYEARI